MNTYKMTYKLMDDKKSSTAQTEKIKDEAIRHYESRHEDIFKFMNNFDNEEIQEEFPNLSINEWEDMAKQRFEESAQ